MILPGVPLPSPEDRDIHNHTKVVITAKQGSLSGVLRRSDSSREQAEEDQIGNCSSSSQRLDTPPNPHQPTPKAGVQKCSTKSAPPRSLNISRQYNQICTTHRRLVKSGAVTCSVSLSDSPPEPVPSSDPLTNTVSLPSAPSSPLPFHPLPPEGSVHWGVVGDCSGVQTPDTPPNLGAVRGVSVIRTAPPAVPARGLHLRPPPLPPAGTEPTPTGTRSGLIARRLSSTDPYLLDSSSTLIVRQPGFSLDQEVFEPVSDQGQEDLSNMDDMNRCEEEADQLKTKRKRLNRKMFEFKEDDINTSRITVMERDLDRISDMKDDYQDDVEDFIEKWRDLIGGVSGFNQWARDVIAVGEEVKAHADRIRTRALQITSSKSASATEARSLEIQEASLKLKELSLKEQQDSRDKDTRDKAAADLLLVDAEANLLLGECSVLGDMLTEILDWEGVDDDVVEDAMRNLGKYQDQMNQVERTFRKYENMSLKHHFPEDKKEAMLATYEDYRKKFEATRDNAKEQDTQRGLFTLEPAKSDIIKYPVFSGSASEDYLKFKETMLQRFRENKVKKKEQVAKLRECLRGVALGRVPEGVTDIDEAFTRLQEAFGNPSKLMAFNLKSLEDLGQLPSEKSHNGQYNYARQIEWYLKLEVILTKILDLSKRSSKLSHEAFASSTYRKLWDRFPTNIIQKLIKVPGEDGQRLEGILVKITRMREQAQAMDDECGSTITSTAKKKPDSVKMTAEIFFRPAQRFGECRICVSLSATSSGEQNLFDNHLSNYATGCPKFMEATTETRKNLVRKVKLCPQCFHPDVIFAYSHIKECPFTKKKNKYSCLEEKCRDHMWICLTHRQKNKTAMQQFDRDMQRQGLSLSFSIYIPLQANQASSHELLSAVRKVRRVEKKKGMEVVPIPEGDPLFLFHAAQGKTAPVNTFYDGGCSHAVFKDGVPGEQLRGQLVTKGPFTIGGVGGLTTQALDEWVVSVPRSDGRKQLIQGLTVKKITSEFPMTNLEAAFKEVREDDPSNTILQECKVPALAGGVVDMLLGIKYNSIFPTPVHTLPSGLTIYKSRLASHGGKYDSCIGGPHSSFSILANLAGGAAQLIGHFVDGLKAYRQFGPPKLSAIAMTKEEIHLANEYNAAEGGVMETGRDLELEQLEDLDQSYDEEVMTDMISCCIHCPSNTTSIQAKVAHDERIREFKRLQGIQEAGLDVEYRCPRCRDCQDCKSADQTEKISIREECEMFEIGKSVILDFEQKKIQCSLPLRGKERDFLTNNREKAKKILDQQIKKYHDDPDTLQTVLAAFAKLFNNGHARLLSDLSKEELEQFMQKEVQHHIPWRVVFSGSLTTPCRPVLDASSRTGYRADRSGGRCLNDLVCKGKIDSLNLVKVLLRFIIGRCGITGDLQQFYNACKLNAQQWNLQRFLWVENLDPKGEVLEAVLTTLIYGVKSVSAQSEFALKQLADHIKDAKPELALFLIMSRYVDDLMDSKSTVEDCTKLAEAADELFATVGLKCKAWSFSGSPPSSVVSKDGLSLGAGGFGWFPEGDFLELKVPRLHFGKARRGKMADSVKFFSGSEEEIDDFVPNPLSRRQAASKLASLWDILGKLAPIMNGLKLNLREVFQATEGWDDAMPGDLRQKCVKNFLMFEQLRGLKYSRAVMPPDAVDTKLRLLTGVDAAKEGLMMGCWGGFKVKDGSWSNQLIIGRSVLSRNESIPKSELEALCGGSNMAWTVRIALSDWVETSILFGDSMIALCWLMSEKLRLSLFHRNRVLQTRRGTELDDIYHVGTEFNPADCGTRPSKVKLSDIGPDSRWENGDQWMKLDIAVRGE